MPNGAGSPYCGNCRFIVTSDDKKECGLHDFIIPKCSLDILCKDYQHYKSHSEHHFGSLSPGILYHYSYASNQQPIPLDKFEHFKRLIEYIVLTLVDDPEFGWAIYYVNPTPNSGYQLENKVTIQIDNKKYLFEVAQAQRIYYGGVSRQNDGTWEQRWSKGTQNIIFSPSDPYLLYKWLDKQFDVEKVLYKLGTVRSESLSVVRLFILCEPDEVENILHIRPYIPMYGEFARPIQGKR